MSVRVQIRKPSILLLNYRLLLLFDSVGCLPLYGVVFAAWRPQNVFDSSLLGVSKHILRNIGFCGLDSKYGQLHS